MIQLRALWAIVTRARGLLTLFAIAGAAAFLSIKWIEAKRQRYPGLACIAAACSAAGAAAERPVCLARIQRLAAFEREALRSTNDLLVRVRAEEDRKRAADLAAARHSAERTRAAIVNMEKADAQIAGDRAGADWFGAVNDLAGLRPPRR